MREKITYLALFLLFLLPSCSSNGSKQAGVGEEPIFKKNINITDDANAGFINTNFSNQNITFEICFAKPCKSEENRLKDTITFQ